MANAITIVAVGALAGARTTAAPLAAAAMLRDAASGQTRVVRLLQSDRFGALLRVGAVVELVLDKMPFLGARTSPGALVARSISSGLSGAALASADRRSVASGIALGVLGAVVGAFATLELRRGLQRRAPPLLAALAEDALLYAAAQTLVNRRPASTR